MFLVDTSVWIDHLRVGDSALAARLDAGEVLIHPFVIGELALGNLRQRNVILEALSSLPAAMTADEPEVLTLISTPVRCSAMASAMWTRTFSRPPVSPRSAGCGPGTAA